MTPTDDAAQALEDFAQGPAFDAANATAQLFEAAGDRIATALDRAARSGELSFNNLAESVARDLARMAISNFITGPLSGAVSGLGSSPTPSQNQTKPPVTVNMTVSGVSDAASFNRSQGQISATLARAVNAGQRYL
ncbi:phage tail tape measure C-terminal domain-containing protein [Fretibacter rubidus]|uniref:phage tail tape measure C-terminal domain-containing protein n=1 Tax=Fretibacter rubidus TaxID=570162 RepID=UPI003529E7F6